VSERVIKGIIRHFLGEILIFQQGFEGLGLHLRDKSNSRKLMRRKRGIECTGETLSAGIVERSFEKRIECLTSKLFEINANLEESGSLNNLNGRNLFSKFGVFCFNIFGQIWPGLNIFFVEN